MNLLEMVFKRSTIDFRSRWWSRFTMRTFLKPLKGPQMSSGWPQLALFLLLIEHKRQPASVHSITSPQSLQDQHKQQPTADHFVATNRWVQTKHKQQLILTRKEASPKRLQNQHSWWPTSEHHLTTSRKGGLS